MFTTESRRGHRDATCVLRHATCVLRHVTCVLRHATCEKRHATCEKQYATCVLRHATCEMRDASCEMKFANKSILLNYDCVPDTIKIISPTSPIYKANFQVLMLIRKWFNYTKIYVKCSIVTDA